LKPPNALNTSNQPAVLKVVFLLQNTLVEQFFSDLITITTIVLDCWSMSAAYGSGEGCCLPKTKSQMFIAVEKTAVQDKDFSITFLGLWHPL